MKMKPNIFKRPKSYSNLILCCLFKLAAQILQDTAVGKNSVLDKVHSLLFLLLVLVGSLLKVVFP
jgi:hypothetical protein